MAIHVFSEIQPLKKVLLHRPGKELEHLVPDTLERLLFDDIPFLAGAQKEHDYFADVLRANGAEVVYLIDLMEQTLRHAPGLKEVFIESFIKESGSTALAFSEELKSYLMGFTDLKALVEKTMAGVRLLEVAPSGNGLSAMLHHETQFVLDPIPNLYFTRDPFASIGGGVSINHMFSETRNRETIYADFIFRYHPDYAGNVTLYYTRGEPFSIEGGDIMNLSGRVLVVGSSQRTTPEAIEHLAKNIFSDETSGVQTILVMDIPGIRAFMHLDTVFTQVDYDKFVIHSGILPTLRLFELERGTGANMKIRQCGDSLERVLSRLLDLPKVTLMQCGGKDNVTAQREQWNDGANTLCISPGVVVTYDRNNITNQLLMDNGIKVLGVPSSELSRGRGGPRCMSMPLIRE